MALDPTLQRPGSPGMALDGPPPPPAGASPGSPGLAGLAPSLQLGGSPEILTGILAAGQDIDQKLTAIAQAFPQVGMEISLAKMIVMKALGKVQAAGGQAISPTETGSSFPGGGFESAGL